MNRIVLGTATCLGALLASACGTHQPGSHTRSDTEASELNVALNRRVASTVSAVRETGIPFREVQAFITLAPDDATGQLFVRVDDAQAVQIDDNVAATVLDPETPPQVAVDGSGRIHVAYPASEDPGRKWDTMAIRYIRSDDGGLSWSQPVNAGGVTFGGYRNDHQMHLAADGRVYVAWLDSGFAEAGSRAIYAAITSTSDGGKSWSPVTRVDTGPACECCRVSITSTPDGTVYVAWRKIYDGTVRDIAVASSPDNGRTWSEPQRVFADNWVMGHCPDAGPALAADGLGRLHVAWWTGREGAAGVKYARAEAGTMKFSTPTELNVGEISRASHVHLALHDASVAVVWDDGLLESPRVAIRRSADGGDSFENLSYLSPADYSAKYPVAAFDASGHLAVAWHRYGQGDAMQREISDGGAVWATPAASAAPAIFVQRLR